MLHPHFSWLSLHFTSRQKKSHTTFPSAPFDAVSPRTTHRSLNYGRHTKKCPKSQHFILISLLTSPPPLPCPPLRPPTPTLSHPHTMHHRNPCMKPFFCGSCSPFSLSTYYFIGGKITLSAQTKHAPLVFRQTGLKGYEIKLTIRTVHGFRFCF